MTRDATHRLTMKHRGALGEKLQMAIVQAMNFVLVALRWIAMGPAEFLGVAIDEHHEPVVPKVDHRITVIQSHD
jgi:hypothetical protein